MYELVWALWDATAWSGRTQPSGNPGYLVQPGPPNPLTSLLKEGLEIEFVPSLVSHPKPLDARHIQLPQGSNTDWDAYLFRDGYLVATTIPELDPDEVPPEGFSDTVQVFAWRWVDSEWTPISPIILSRRYSHIIPLMKLCDG